MNRIRVAVDVKRIVAFVLLGSTLGIVFFVFYVLLVAPDDDVGEDTAPTWWRGNSYAGLVVDIDASHLTLHTHAGDNIKFKIDGNTRFVLRGNTPVSAGVEVKVLFRTIRAADTSYMVARTVRVLRADSEASASPDGDERPLSRSPQPSAWPSGVPPSAVPSGRPSPSDVPSGRPSP